MLQTNVIKLRIFLSKQPPESPFSKGDFYGRLLNLMTLCCKHEPAIRDIPEILKIAGYEIYRL